MIYFKYEWISIIKVYFSFTSQTNMVNSEFCITRALRDLSSLLLLEPQLLWSQSLLHLTKGETRVWRIAHEALRAWYLEVAHITSTIIPLARTPSYGLTYLQEKLGHVVFLCVKEENEVGSFATYIYKWSFFVSLFVISGQISNQTELGL